MQKILRAAHHVDMTSGPLAGNILLFSLPLIASGILQQSFNVVDVAVIGNYADKNAIAAVGSNGPIISIIVNLFIGISIGANAVIARFIGQGCADDVRDSVSTVAWTSLVSGFLLLALGTILARPMLEFMSAPPEVIDLATVYLRIYFVGMPFLMVYNFGGAILRSIGDTSKLFYSLAIANTVNVGLDFLFVAAFGWGVAGVAWATVISNGINAAIIVYYLNREPDPYKLTLSPSGWILSRPDLMEMLRIGIPAGLQGMVFSLSNLFIQSSINKFGAASIAGSATALTYEAYCYFVVAGLNGAAIAFTSQNYGAQNPARCKRVWAICMGYSVVLTALCNLLIVAFSGEALRVFTTDPEVTRYALIRFHTVLMFQWVASSYEISGSYMRGLGYSVIPMLLTIFGTCVLRLLWVYIFPKINYSYGTLLEIYPISWFLTGVMVVAAAFIVQRKVWGARNL